jgi:hypothetical protein
MRHDAHCDPGKFGGFLLTHGKMSIPAGQAMGLIYSVMGNNYRAFHKPLEDHPRLVLDLVILELLKNEGKTLLC